MVQRKVIEVPGVAHKNPIPMGAKVGNILFSSAIMGMNPNDGMIPEDPHEEVRLVFQHMRTLVENGGGTLDNIGHVKIYLRNYDLRPYINQLWLEYFPDPHSRPARHVILSSLPDKLNIQAEIIAVLNGCRERSSSVDC